VAGERLAAGRAHYIPTGECPLMAQSRQGRVRCKCPLLGVKRTLLASKRAEKVEFIAAQSNRLKIGVVINSCIG
jgi:hypothetical protein